MPKHSDFSRERFRSLTNKKIKCIFESNKRNSKKGNKMTLIAVGVIFIFSLVRSRYPRKRFKTFLDYFIA